jgi:TonB family protein
MELDESRNPGAFAAFMDGGSRYMHEELPADGRVSFTVVDGNGLPVPFASYTVSVAGKKYRSGRAFADGCFPIYPHDEPVMPDAGTWRFELSCRGGASVLDYDPSHKDANRLVLKGAHALPSPTACDVVFVLDSSISMAKALPALRLAFSEARDMIAAGRVPMALRTGLVLFRDHGDDYLTRSYPLDADPRSLDAALEGMRADGGGDVPEDLGAGLRAAINGMDWAPDSVRLLVAVTDAVPALRPGDPAAKGSRYADACRTALAMGIRIVTVGMGKPEQGGEFALRQIEGWTGAPYLAADRPGGPAYGSLGEDARARPSGIVRDNLENAISRIVSGEVLAAGPGGGTARDPALALLEGVQARMAAGLTYPQAARIKGISGTAVLSLDVGADGRLLGIHLAASSGSSILDHAALDLALASFPAENPVAGAVRLEIAIEYRLN